MEQSLEIFIEGMDKRVPEVLPVLGPVPSLSFDLGGGAKGKRLDLCNLHPQTSECPPHSL